jgi:RNA polymerase sigma-70 factor (ECF subfamily)
MLTVRRRIDCHRHGYHRRVPPAEPEIVDEPLDAAFAAGRADLKSVYDEHGPLVYSLCRRAIGADAAHDVTQEVFVSAWRGRDQFDPRRGNLAQWLVGITKRRIVDHLRRERRHVERRVDDRADAGAEYGASSESHVDRLADRLLVAQGLARLDARAREVISLAYIHDFTHQEIADRTGIPLGTVKSDIRRGLTRIRDHLEPSDG